MARNRVQGRIYSVPGTAIPCLGLFAGGASSYPANSLLLR
jgi:hypothetical protein